MSRRLGRVYLAHYALQTLVILREQNVRALQPRSVDLTFMSSSYHHNSSSVTQKGKKITCSWMRNDRNQFYYPTRPRRLLIFICLLFCLFIISTLININKYAYGKWIDQYTFTILIYNACPSSSSLKSSNDFNLHI